MKAVVLKTIPYQDSGKIAQIYSEDLGLISVLIKRLSKKNTHLQNIISPLSLSEFELTKRKSDLYFFGDATLIDPFLELRRNLDRLTAAGHIVKTLLKSQSHCRPSKPLFLLLTNYLRALKETPNPSNYALSFLSKVLRLEGVFPLEKEDFPLPLENSEWEALAQLAYATSHDAITEPKLPIQLEEKIYEIFPILVTP